MIKTILSTAILLPVFAMAQLAKAPAKNKTPAKATTSKPVISPVKSSLDSFSYAIGMNIASNLKAQGISNVNSTLVVKAFNDVFSGGKPLMDLQACNQVVQQRFAGMAEQKANVDKQQANVQKVEGLKFLNENKKRPEVKTTSSGLEYEILKAGTGPMPVDTNTVKVHYTGTLINGKKFDSSVDRGEPIDLRVNGVIPGWTEALKLMPVGSKWKLYIPSTLAYGDRGAGDIPPGSTLIFEVELLAIVN